GLELDCSALGRVCADVEHHPDNVAPAIYGGAVLAVPGPEGRLTVAPLEVHASLVFVFAVPDFAVETEQARAALPASVSHHTAATAAAKAAALVAGLARADARLLAAALDDTLAASGRTLGEAVADVAARFPALGPRLRDKDGNPYPFVVFYLNDEDVRFRGGFAAPVQDGDEVTVIPAIAGGGAASQPCVRRRNAGQRGPGDGLPTARPAREGGVADRPRDRP